MTGMLINLDGRPDIIWENGGLYGGLHCGECFLIFEPDAGWVPVRLEFSDDWVLVEGSGVRTAPFPYGRRVML